MRRYNEALVDAMVLDEAHAARRQARTPAAQLGLAPPRDALNDTASLPFRIAFLNELVAEAAGARCGGCVCWGRGTRRGGARCTPARLPPAAGQACKQTHTPFAPPTLNTHARTHTHTRSLSARTLPPRPHSPRGAARVPGHHLFRRPAGRAARAAALDAVARRAGGDALLRALGLWGRGLRGRLAVGEGHNTPARPPAPPALPPCPSPPRFCTTGATPRPWQRSPASQPSA